MLLGSFFVMILALVIWRSSYLGFLSHVYLMCYDDLTKCFSILDFWLQDPGEGWQIEVKDSRSVQQYTFVSEDECKATIG